MLLCPSFFARLICGRRSVAQKLDVILTNQTNLETMMSDILDKLNALKAQADEYTTTQGKRLVDAVAAARKAQQAEDAESAKAEMAAALAKIDEISKGLVEFSPSAN